MLAFVPQTKCLRTQALSRTRVAKLPSAASFTKLAAFLYVFMATVSVFLPFLQSDSDIDLGY